MSDLRYKTVTELKEIKTETESYIASLSSQISGQIEKLKWVDQYLFEKTPQEMTWDQLERKLGHKIIIKD